MTKRAIISVFLLATISLVAQTMNASALTWLDHIGTTDSEPDAVYSLLANSFLRPNLSSTYQNVQEKWLKAHPQATIVVVAIRQPIYDNKPASRMFVVWVVDNGDYLNVELIRQGCVAAQTMQLVQEDALSVPPQRYKEIMTLAGAAEVEARQKARGIWAKQQIQ